MEIPELSVLRRVNLLQLFSDYVAKRMADAPSEQISGLDREFSALIQVHNTYFSGMKSGARTIGDKLARQVEVLCKKSSGWMAAKPHPVAAVHPERAPHPRIRGEGDGPTRNSTRVPPTLLPTARAAS